MHLIDVHTHILPGADDGAPDIETACRMLRIAALDGIGTVILTPHAHPDKTYITKEEQFKRFAVLDRLCRENPQFYPQVRMGNEIYYLAETVRQLQNEEICTMNGTRIVLTEFGFTASFSEIRQAMNRIQMAGYKPMLAHVERYGMLTADQIAQLAAAGVLLQVNADAVLGNYGHSTKRLVRNLMKEDLITCVASDAHSTGHRAPRLSEAYEKTAREFGETYADALFYANAADIFRI